MPLTINELIVELKKYPKDAEVVFDFCNCIPTIIASYRGYYDRPALGWRPSGYSARANWNIENHTAETLVAELGLATSGVYYEGWKGGEYRYTKDQVLYVDNPGDYSSTVIDSVSYEYYVILHTKKIDE